LLEKRKALSTVDGIGRLVFNIPFISQVLRGYKNTWRYSSCIMHRLKIAWIHHLSRY